MDREQINKKLYDIAKEISAIKFKTYYNTKVKSSMIGHFIIDDDINPILKIKVALKPDSNRVELSLFTYLVGDFLEEFKKSEPHRIYFNIDRPTHILAKDIIKRGYKQFTQENLSMYNLLIRPKSYLEDKTALCDSLLALGLVGDDDIFYIPNDISERIDSVRVEGDRLRLKLASSGVSFQEFKAILKFFRRDNEEKQSNE